MNNEMASTLMPKSINPAAHVIPNVARNLTELPWAPHERSLSAFGMTSSVCITSNDVLNRCPKKLPRLLIDLQHRPLPVARSRRTQQVADGVDGLAVFADYPADVALPELEFENDLPGVFKPRQYHLIGELDKLADDKLEKFFHGFAFRI